MKILFDDWIYNLENDKDIGEFASHLQIVLAINPKATVKLFHEAPDA